MSTPADRAWKLVVDHARACSICRVVLERDDALPNSADLCGRGWESLHKAILEDAKAKGAA